MDMHAMRISPAASDFPLQMSSLGVSSSSMPWAVHEQVSCSFGVSNDSKFYSVVYEPNGRENETAYEHHSAINDEAISADNGFFVTASDESTVKIWDSRKLEKDITFGSRLTYHLNESRGLGNVDKYSGIADITKKNYFSFFLLQTLLDLLLLGPLFMWLLVAMKFLLGMQRMVSVTSSSILGD
ncbi:unnamed protein product [Lupinus luteus]|uniref:Uncharacterized protein n=1 Tax=Lupinus luteus TaxID=3873 RepID=A0AAV1WTP0_LUPLU